MNNVSVVIPAFNSPYLAEAIDSVLDQTRPASEIIVVDSSPDMTLSVINRYGDRIKYLYQPPRGVSAARNLGIREAKSEYVALLDADDFWYSQKLDVQLEAFSMFPNAIFIFSAIWNFYAEADHQIAAQPYDHPALMKWVRSTGSVGDFVLGSIYDVLLESNCVATSSVMIRKDGLLDQDLFDERFNNGEDYEFWLRLAKQSEAIFVTRPLSRYRIHDGGLSGSWEARSMPFYHANLRVLEKHWQLYPSPAVRRAISRTKAQLAVFQMKTDHPIEAKRMALESFRSWPNWVAAKLFIETTFPGFYSAASRWVH